MHRAWLKSFPGWLFSYLFSTMKPTLFLILIGSLFLLPPVAMAQETEGQEGPSILDKIIEFPKVLDGIKQVEEQQVELQKNMIVLEQTVEQLREDVSHNSWFQFLGGLISGAVVALIGVRIGYAKGTRERQ